jgi:hypothetical protein
VNGGICLLNGKEIPVARMELLNMDVLKKRTRMTRILRIIADKKSSLPYLLISLDK